MSRESDILEFQRRDKARHFADQVVSDCDLPEPTRTEWWQRAYEGVLGGPDFDWDEFKKVCWNGALLEQNSTEYVRLRDEFEPGIVRRDWEARIRRLCHLPARTEAAAAKK